MISFIYFFTNFLRIFKPPVILVKDTHGALLTIYSPNPNYFTQPYFPFVVDPFLFPCAQPKFLQWAFSEFSAHEVTLFLDYNLPVDLADLRRVYYIQYIFQLYDFSNFFIFYYINVNINNFQIRIFELLNFSNFCNA